MLFIEVSFSFCEPAYQCMNTWYLDQCERVLTMKSATPISRVIISVRAAYAPLLYSTTRHASPRTSFNANSLSMRAKAHQIASPDTWTAIQNKVKMGHTKSKPLL